MNIAQFPPLEVRKQARVLASLAILRGDLIRPDTCSRCGESPDSAVHAHHPDYFKPLEVKWLCRRCHGKEHQRLNAAEKERRGPFVGPKPLTEKRNAVLLRIMAERSALWDQLAHQESEINERLRTEYGVEPPDFIEIDDVYVDEPNSWRKDFHQGFIDELYQSQLR